MFDEKRLVGELKKAYKVALRNAGIASYEMYQEIFPTDFIKRLWFFSKVRSAESLRNEYFNLYTVFPRNNLDNFFIKKYNMIAEALNEKSYLESKICEDNYYIERAKNFAPNHDIALMIQRTDSYKEALRKEKLKRNGYKEEVKGQIAKLVDTVLYEVEYEMKFEFSSEKWN